MSIKLVLLKSGETVITDLKELVDDEDKLVSYVFENPYVVRLITPRVLFESDEQIESEHKVSFYPWIVLSNDKQIVVNKDWIISIVSPNDMVMDSYVDRIYEPVKENLIENFEVIQEEKDG